MDLTPIFLRLSKADIIGALPSKTFSCAEKRNCAKLEDAVSRLPEHEQHILVHAADGKPKKWQCHKIINDTNIASPIHEENQNPMEVETGTFFDTVLDDCRRCCVTDFIDATGNNAVCSAVCAVCAGEFFAWEMDEISISALKEKNLLSPHTAHPAHNLFHRMLLHVNQDSTRSEEDNSIIISLCHSCNCSLKRGQTPALALANHMWIGDVPLHLRILTLPEHVLIARHFPAAYIVKLYPKKKGARHWPAANMQTFFPQPSALLLVRVLSTLQWLKENNPLYSNVIISETCLNNLPMNDIPEELIAITKHSVDETLLSQETDDYVPEDMSNDENTDMETDHIADEMQDDDTRSLNVQEPDTIPLHSLGVVDVASSDVTEHDMLANALANVSRMDKKNMLIYLGMCVLKNPPSLWITINPANTQDPIVQVFCGEDIDLDQFCSIDQHPSEAAIAADPYAVSRFFHFMIKAILECLLGISRFKHNQHVQWKPGIFGLVEGYISTVEAQGRGTLHLHLVVWLSGSVPADKMRELFVHDAYRMHVKNFIKANVHADLTNIHGNSTLSLQPQHRIAFSRLVDPRSPDFEKEKDNAEKIIARTVQVHQCSHSCMKITNGHYTCKRKAPFPLADDDWVDKDGNWEPKRTFPYFNNWSPEILQCLRANHIVKLITNGIETKDIVWYIAGYVSKNLTSLLKRTFPSLRGPRSFPSTDDQGHDCSENADSAEDIINMEIVDGHVYIKDQVQEYVYHGQALESMNYLSFFLDTYDGLLPEQSLNAQGRLCNTQIPYLECQWFPKNEHGKGNGLYEASMLALLKPWRSPLDLRQSGTTFQEAYNVFLTSASDDITSIITNITFFHESLDCVTQNCCAEDFSDENVEHDHHTDNHLQNVDACDDIAG
ncbi:hypothetical protein EI94DRAFT_1704361 [Lactarius quietus]|nr:hypothetical protein EI94DRAFT_1704361 [Lactarius quietus]